MSTDAQSVTTPEELMKLMENVNPDSLPSNLRDAVERLKVKTARVKVEQEMDELRSKLESAVEPILKPLRAILPIGQSITLSHVDGGENTEDHISFSIGNGKGNQNLGYNRGRRGSKIHRATMGDQKFEARSGNALLKDMYPFFNDDMKAKYIPERFRDELPNAGLNVPSILKKMETDKVIQYTTEKAADEEK